MKKVLIFLINVYQKISIRTPRRCIYYPTCSEYSKEAIKKYGAFKGVFLSIKRIIRCNPLCNGGYDPVK